MSNDPVNLTDLLTQRAKERALATVESAPTESTAPVVEADELPRPTATVESVPTPSAPTKSAATLSVATDSIPLEPVTRLYVKVPHAVLDGALSHLGTSAQLVYLHLLRLSLGHSRDTCKIGSARLQERTGIGETAVARAVKDLERAGLVVRLGVDGKSANAERGTEYRVLLPAAAVDSVVAKSAPTDLVVAPTRSMKETPRERIMETAPTKFDLRTIAARHLEVDRTLTGDDLAAKLRDYYTGRGIVPDEATIAAALEGVVRHAERGTDRRGHQRDGGLTRKP